MIDPKTVGLTRESHEVYNLRHNLYVVGYTQALKKKQKNARVKIEVGT